MSLSKCIVPNCEQPIELPLSHQFCYECEILGIGADHLEYVKAKDNNWKCQHNGCDTDILGDVTIKWCQHHLYVNEGIHVTSDDI